MAYEAKIIKDSICNGYRLTTMQLTHPRIVHSEFMTHCAFARNASSSRAIPFERMLKIVHDDPFIPIYWGRNQPGMQAREEISESEKKDAVRIWLESRDDMIEQAKVLHGVGVHKQITNRLLECFGWITVLVTGDPGAWSNYFAQRCHADAQPEIEKQASMAREIYFASSPQELCSGQWHLPYMNQVDGESSIGDPDTLALLGRDFRHVSVGRCARVSYLTQEGKRDPEKDVELCMRLMLATPMHASPFEHVCQATGDGARHGKYAGWKSFRHMLKDEYDKEEYITDFRTQ